MENDFLKNLSPSQVDNYHDKYSNISSYYSLNIFKRFCPLRLSAQIILCLSNIFLSHKSVLRIFFFLKNYIYNIWYMIYKNLEKSKNMFFIIIFAPRFKSWWRQCMRKESQRAAMLSEKVISYDDDHIIIWWWSSYDMMMILWDGWMDGRVSEWQG